MKKATCIFLISIVVTAVHAQLKNTKWNGIIHADSDIKALFHYTSDSLIVTNLADNSNVETMTYKVKGNVLILQKVYGQSDCNTSGTGQYKFEIKDNVLYITLVADACEDRSSALSNSKWDKIKD